MKTISTFLLAGLFILGICSCNQGKKSKENLTTVRIGWQIPLATQGQIVQVMKNTNVLEKNGLLGDFISFSYGGPQSEAALAGQLDVIFVGDQPAVNLIAKGGKWKIVSRLFYTKTAIMVPLESPINAMIDFKGKTLASPFGSVAHREAILKQQAAGLDADKDLNNVNLDILEISTVVQSGGRVKWGNLDAVAVWEPSTSLFEMNNFARVIDYTYTLGVIAVSEDFISKHPDAVTNLLKSVVESWHYFAQNQTVVNEWYKQDARLDYSPELLSKAASIDPNISAKGIADIDLSLSEINIQSLNIAAQWAFERGFTKNKSDISKAVDLSFYNKAISLLPNNIDLETVKSK
ncbi:MAG: NrtA/SsuA/CpmA family ABC transporter substrate-binding protein [Bacteroidia bacterium]|nr:NrtA/SsuA/CpmA family ABC transporter substrate-binding protein [Bacteroidia bacterium]